MGFFRKKNIPIPDQYKKKKIKAEEVADLCSYSFLKAANNFFASGRLIKNEINWHNDENDKYVDMIEKVLACKYELTNLDKMILTRHKAKKNELLSDINNRNTLDITCGFLELECITECNEIRPDDVFRKDSFISRCLSDRNKEKAAKELKDFIIPSELEMQNFYEICKEYQRLFYAEKEGNEEKISDMFGHNGTVMIKNKSGQYIQAEDDPLHNFEEIDYRGVI